MADSWWQKSLAAMVKLILFNSGVFFSLWNVLCCYDSQKIPPSLHHCVQILKYGSAIPVLGAMSSGPVVLFYIWSEIRLR